MGGVPYCKSLCPHPQNQIKLEAITIHIPTPKSRDEEFKEGFLSTRDPNTHVEETVKQSKSKQFAGQNNSDHKSESPPSAVISKQSSKNQQPQKEPTSQHKKQQPQKPLYINLPEDPNSTIHRHPAEVQAVVEHNHLVVPQQIVLAKVKRNEMALKLVKKEVSVSPLLSQQKQTWYLLASGNYYNGRLLQGGEPSNVGTYVLNDGKIYHGQTKQGHPEGHGILIDGQKILKGKFKEGELDGENGSMEIVNQGIIVSGDWQKGQIIKGRIQGPKSSYVGTFFNGVPDGEGTYQRSQRKIFYEGGFKQGKFEGKGKYSCETYVFTGEFREGKKHGKGTIQYFPNKVNHNWKGIVKGVWQKDRMVSS